MLIAPLSPLLASTLPLADWHHEVTDGRYTHIFKGEGRGEGDLKKKSSCLSPSSIPEGLDAYCPPRSYEKEASRWDGAPDGSGKVIDLPARHHSILILCSAQTRPCLGNMHRKIQDTYGYLADGDP